MEFKLLTHKNILIIIYKLLNDLLFLTLAFFLLALIADGAIPGIVSDHISFLKIIIFIFLVLCAIHIFGNLAEIKTPEKKINKKTAIFLSVIAALLIFNSLLKLNIFLSVFILIVSLAVGYFIYKNIFEKN